MLVVTCVLFSNADMWLLGYILTIRSLLDTYELFSIAASYIYLFSNAAMSVVI
jgi:hypothetical protein